MKKIIVFMVTGIFMVFASDLFSYPKEVIIIRHADKLEQSKPGPALSPSGVERSIQFAFYFLKKFNEPDYMIATDPVNDSHKNSSIRELQTLAPLNNMLAERHPEKGFVILHHYASSDYNALAEDILHNKKFDNKRILICWNHKSIPELAKKLGVKTPINAWSGSNFDRVLVLQYDISGQVATFEVLDHQYPISHMDTWEDLKNKLK